MGKMWFVDTQLLGPKRDFIKEMAFSLRSYISAQHFTLDVSLVVLCGLNVYCKLSAIN